MTFSPEIVGGSIIVVGNFNPAIFTPDWFVQNDIIGPEDGETARTSNDLVVSSQGSNWQTEWFVLQVSDDRLELASKGPVTPSFRDLGVSIFTLLPHTPVAAVGLNVMGHFKLDTSNDYHKIGDVLAPKTVWAKLFPGDDVSIGLESLTLKIDPHKRGDVDTTISDSKRVTLQSSRKIQYGIFLAFNDHYDIRSRKELAAERAASAAKRIGERWEGVYSEALETFDKLLTSVLQSPT